MRCILRGVSAGRPPGRRERRYERVIAEMRWNLNAASTDRLQQGQSKNEATAILEIGRKKRRGPDPARTKNPNLKNPKALIPKRLKTDSLIRFRSQFADIDCNTRPIEGH